MPANENEQKPVIPPEQGPSRSADSEEEVENPVRIRPAEGPAGTPGRVGNERIIHPPSTHSDPYPGVHVH